MRGDGVYDAQPGVLDVEAEHELGVTRSMPRHRASKFRPLSGFRCVMPCTSFPCSQKGLARPMRPYAVGTDVYEPFLGRFFLLSKRSQTKGRR